MENQGIPTIISTTTYYYYYYYYYHHSYHYYYYYYSYYYYYYYPYRGWLPPGATATIAPPLYSLVLPSDGALG